MWSFRWESSAVSPASRDRENRRSSTRSSTRISSGFAAPATEESAGACDAVEGADRVGEVVMVDQSPLSRTPRSSPGALSRHLRLHPRSLCRDAPGSGARAHGRRVFFQFRRGPLRTMQRQRLRKDRDAVSERRLRALPGMRRAPLSGSRPERVTWKEIDPRRART